MPDVMITCPACHRTMRGAESIIGKTVKCPACKTQFAVTGGPAPEPEPVAAPIAEEHAEPGGPQSQARAGPSTFVDYLVFRRMITPIVIQVIFWIGILFVLYVAVSLITDSLGSTKEQVIGNQKIIQKTEFSWRGMLIGVAFFFVGPLLWRMYCEVLIVFFRMNETLTDVRHGIDRLRKD